MQDPEADTSWNDALRRHGILPAKKEITEDQIISLIDEAAEKRLQFQGHDLGELSVEELDLLEDDEDERILLDYRRRRIAEMQAATQREAFGDIRDISASDWVDQVNKAGDDVTVVVFLFKDGVPICELLNRHLQQLAAKFRAVKFVRGRAECCIPNFPEDHLPCVMIYRKGTALHKFVGPSFWGNRPTVDAVEWLLAKKGKAFETELEEDPRPRTQDVLMSELKVDTDDDDADGW